MVGPILQNKIVNALLPQKEEYWALTKSSCLSRFKAMMNALELPRLSVQVESSQGVQNGGVLSVTG